MTWMGEVNDSDANRYGKFRRKFNGMFKTSVRQKLGSELKWKE